MSIYFIFFFYQFFTILALVPFCTYIIVRKLQKKPYAGSITERLGFVPKVIKKNTEKLIWIHAVSVGEVLSIANILNLIKAEIPDAKFYVTTGTIGGYKIAKKSVAADYISFLPFDFLPFFLLAFRRIKPDKIIIVEADFWPNFLLLSHFRKIPIFAINARMREKSFPRYSKFSFFLKPILMTIKKLFVQTKEDAIRFEKFGIPSKNLAILGDIKSFNVLKKAKNTKSNFEKPKEYKVILAGSIHQGEFHTCLQLFKRLKPNFANLKLILAPRHFHWMEELTKKLNNEKISFELWDESTSATNSLDQIFETKDILVVAKLGLLFNLYNACDIFILGGTFVPVGGHNLLEPAVFGKPSFVGPNHQNCKDFADKLENNNGLIKVDSTEKLIEKISYLLSNDNLINDMGRNARLVLDTESKIVEERLIELIKLLKIDSEVISNKQFIS